MAGVIHLVVPPLSKETIDLLAITLDGARRGDIVGVALVILHPGRDYTLDVAGLAREDPTWTRGMLAKLDDKLAVLPPRRT